MLSRFISVTLVFLCFLGSSIIPSHAAKIYHWVDDKGQPHYSENPPREIQAKELNVRAAGTGSAGSSSALSASKNKTKAATKSVKKTSDEEQSLTAEHSPEEKAKYCQQSRTLLQSMNTNTQRRFEQPDGSYRKLEQAEIADYQAQAQSGIERYCN